MTDYKIAVSRFAVSKKLLPGDPNWKRFNAGFSNVEIDVPDIVDAVYKGQAITTQHRNNWRASENYLCGQHLGLDFDNGDTTSSLTNLLKDKFISKYAAFLYTTMSHTEEHPRSRAIFVLDRPIMQAKNYSLAASALLWLFGGADRQCKDAVRFFYGSPNCQIEFVNSVLPLDVVMKLIDNYKESGRVEKRQAVHTDYIAPATQKEVADALKFIPPWGVDYDQWVEILMGIHHQFGDAGYMLAESWADGKPGEVEQKWRSFKESGNPEGTITIATVFGIAKKYGWRKG